MVNSKLFPHLARAFVDNSTCVSSKDALHQHGAHEAGRSESGYDDYGSYKTIEIVLEEGHGKDTITEGESARESLGLASAMFHVYGMVKGIFKSRLNGTAET
jgi:hypothetical protein